MWDIGKFERRTGEWLSEGSENILWVTKLGSTSYGTPVVAGDKIFCATNNGAGYVPRYPKDIDLGVLLCFDRADGKFRWQLSREKLSAGKEVDWPHQGICAAPLVEEERLWIVTNRGEVLCLDTEGFNDCENDGPDTGEDSTALGEADIVWRFDMMKELGVIQHNMASCSVTALGDLLFVHTGNGRDDNEPAMEAPEAPSFIALDKTTGKLAWADASPGANVLHGQWGSPAAAEIDGVKQVVFPGGDGWLYSFLAEKSETNRPKLLWRFDCNPKDSQWEAGGMGDRNNIIATPVIKDGRVYIATGQDPEYGEGQGRLWCIDPTRRGDVSETLVIDSQGGPVPFRREQAVDESAGEQIVQNPNSAVIWKYEGDDLDEDGELVFEETMHRSLSMPSIVGEFLVIADCNGMFHCLDAKTGKLHWAYDMYSEMWGSPTIADGKIFMGDCDGEIAVFELSKEMNLLEENYVGSAIYSTPVIVDGVIYIATSTHLIAVKKKK